jgi:hypothetical protein
MAKQTAFSQELEALGTILGVLEPLDDEKRRFVLKTAYERLGIANPVTPKAGDAPANARNAGGSGVTPNFATLDGVTPKAFLKAKKPITDVQRVACLAYYLTNARQMAHFKTKDITSLNTEAAGDRFSNAALAVNNATNQNRFLAPAGKGNKQITGHGEDVVNALPDQEAVNAAVAGYKKPRRKGGSRKNKVK